MKKMKLTDRVWKSFTVEDLFTRIVPTKGETTGQLIIGNDVPYIAAAKNNNGFAGVYSCKEYPNWVSKGNCIVFVQLGDGAAGLAYYVPMNFIGMSGKTSCGYIDGTLNKYNGIFIAKILSMNKAVFSHGHSWTGKRLLKTRIMLPSSSDGKPDYQFMEDYIRELLNKKIAQYKEYANSMIINAEKRISIKEKSWAPFSIPSVFDTIQRGKRLKKADQINGDTPYVSSTSLNNGVDGFITATFGTRVFSNCISLANSGSVGKAFYEPFSFVASDHITHLKSSRANMYIYLFLISTLEKQKANFNFNREINDPRIEAMRIMLPADDEGNPDYAFMEQYGKMLVAKKYKQYLDYLGNDD